MAQSTTEQMQAGMDAWMARAGKVGDALMDLGLPLGNSTAVKAGGVTPSNDQALATP